MSFLVRAVRREDIIQLTDLAKQFNLLNLEPQLNLLISKKMKLLTKYLAENNHRQVGAEGVNLIYTLNNSLS